MDESAALQDTAARSLAHWSEAGREEMDAFYAFARLDYTMLAAVLDWGALLDSVSQRQTGGGRTLNLLDVACGSGKFPAALLAETDLSAVADVRIDYDLLDPSAFSLAEAAAVLAPPFHERARHEQSLEELDPDAGPWDVVWATHALYAIGPHQLDAGARRLAAAIAPGGIGFVAQGSREGHYIRVYEAFLTGVRDEAGTPYTTVEEIAAALTSAGAPPAVRRISYEHTVAGDQLGLLEGYLQRCLFDDSMSLEQMLEAPVLGPYLEGCRDPTSGTFRFPQEVDCLLIDPQGGPPPWTAGR